MLTPVIGPLDKPICMRDTETSETLHCYSSGVGDLGLVWRLPDQKGTASGRKVATAEALALLNNLRAADSSWGEWHLDTTQGMPRFVRITKQDRD